MNANLKYITFDQLMASVESDLDSFADSGMINRGTCIKIVRKVNEDLGLKIFQEKEHVIKIKDYKGELPLDFRYLQMAVLCNQPVSYQMPGGILGTHTIEQNVDTTCVRPDKVCMNSCDGIYWVTQQYKDKVVTQNSLIPLRISPRGLKFCSDKCLNYRWSEKATYELDIAEEEVVTNFREGDVYVNYMADMVDEGGNVLVLDHPMLTAYYEYAVKKHLLEKYFLNGESDVVNKLKFIKDELRSARIEALNFINTIEYTEIQDVYTANRTRFYNKYHKIFY